jgi:prepilin-type N-terminal cleavage/methylation domain-containing protein
MNRPTTVGRKQGFTLIEIMVVLVIAAIISSITFGSFRSITEGNKRTNCQSNLSQIYISCRQYAQDFDGRFPYLNNTGAPDQAASKKGGLGLWSLYTFPKLVTVPNDPNCSSESVDLPLVSENPELSRSINGYVRSVRVFHCPSDNNEKEIQYRDPSDACVAKKVNTGVLTFTEGVNTYTNPSYLSYQTQDDVPMVTGGPYTDTYSSFRGPDIPKTATTPAKPVRQLVPYVIDSASVVSVSDRPMREMTVITWCRFHRRIDSSTNKTISGRRNYDNVLFSDGSVQNLPTEQDVSQDGLNTRKCFGWERVPRGKADKMPEASGCIPSP